MIPLRYRGTAVALIPVAGIMATLATWAWTRGEVRVANDWVRHTQSVLIESDRLLITALNAETGVRGYVITGDESFLEHYYAALQVFPQKSQRLNQLLQDDASQRQRLNAIARLIQEQFRLLQRRIDLRQEEDLDFLVRDAQLPYQGKALMDEVRARLAEFQGIEQQFLTERQKKLEQVRNWVSTGVASIGSLSILSSLVAIVMFYRIDWRMEEQSLRLQQGRSLMRSLVANVVDGVITLDPQGKITTLNDAAVEMFGYERPAMLDQNADMFLAAVPQDENQLLRVEGNLKPMGRRQMLGCRQNGSVFPIDVSISEIEGDSQWLMIVRDITDLKQSEAKLQARADEMVRLNLLLAATNANLQERNSELDQFAYVTSHDLKAPLRAIANLSEWLEEDLKTDLPPENQHQLRLLRGRVHRMEALINGLLQYSRIGRVDLPVETINVKQLLDEVLESLNPPAEFRIDIAPGMPILHTKRLLLSQVFANLIGNAINHHPHKNGHIKVDAQDEGDRYRFGVADDGAGIAPEFQNKIFTIFQTLEPRDTVENTGIGLAIVKKIVESGGGSIRVISQVGEGARFEFTWLK